MSTLVTAWMLGCVTGFFMGAYIGAASFRKTTCRELMRDPTRRPILAGTGYQPLPRQDKGTPNPPPFNP